jgi:hypothetical protein
MRAIGKTPGKKRPVLEVRDESVPSHASGKAVNHERLIDRRMNRYVERVTDPTTGEVLHECDEPLSDHQGHGDARRRKDSDA